MPSFFAFFLPREGTWPTWTPIYRAQHNTYKCGPDSWPLRLQSSESRPANLPGFAATTRL